MPTFRPTLRVNLESKRVQMAVRFFTYGLMTAVTVVLSAIVLLLALGYRFNRDTLTFVRDGLVQLSTAPVNANYVFNGGKLHMGSAPARLTLNSGLYHIQLSYPGYRPWSKDLTVIAGHVHWITYPRLIPISLHPSQLKKFDQLSFAEVSPNGQWLLLYFDQGPNNKNQIELVDLSNPKKLVYSTLTLPAQTLTQQSGPVPGDLSFLEWSLDSQHVLLKYTAGTTADFLSLDITDPSAVVNLTQLFQLPIAEVHYSGSDPNTIYALTSDNVLRSLNVSSDEVTGALLDGIRQFQVYGSDEIVYDRTFSANGSAGSQPVQQTGLLIGGTKTIVETLPATHNVFVDYNEFDNHSYFVVSDATTHTVTVWQDPQNPATTQPFLTINDIAPQYVDFDAAGRFLLLQQGGHLIVYDFYESQKFDYNLPFSLPAAQDVYWIDDFHLAAAIDGQLEMWEFDGTNYEEMIPSSSSLYEESILDNGNDMLYSFSTPSKSKPGNIGFYQTNLKLH
ncbi:MAG TPA: PEGA domain-containing protein [Candidatus Saccharimonadales bacterium]|nr:PEGA domain-containing protein [Candidatus Saccharimonadales bacterium]